MDKLKLSDDVLPNSKYKRDRRNAMLETVSSKESFGFPDALSTADKGFYSDSRPPSFALRTKVKFIKL